MCIAVVLACCAPAQSSRRSSIATTDRDRPGIIESVAPVEEDRAPSDKAVDDAFILLITGGLLLGNLLFDHGTGSVVGAGDAPWPSTSHEEDTTSLPRYSVLVRFDDGGSMTLEYRGDVPFERGDRVALTRRGLLRRDAATGS